MNRYTASQSYHTLTHWQSVKRDSGPYTSYIDGTTNFILQGFKDAAGDLVLFPWTLREVDGIAGETWYGASRSRYPYTAYYVQPETTTVVAAKWTTSDGYDVYYKISKAGKEIHTSPGRVPFEGTDVEEKQYCVLSHKDGALIAPVYDDGLGGGTASIHVSYDETLALTSGYTGKVALPILNRYKIYWNYYASGETSIAEWCVECVNMGTTSESLGITPSKWDASTIVALSKLCAKLYPYEWLHEVPRLTNLSPVWFSGSGANVYRWPTLRGGGNEDDDDAKMYVAGAECAIAYGSQYSLPYIVTGLDPVLTSAQQSPYGRVAPGTALSVTASLPTESCILAGDMGIPWQDGAEGYYPLNIGYNNNLSPYGYVGTAENGISTIVRRIHDIEVQEEFSFFTA